MKPTTRLDRFTLPNTPDSEALAAHLVESALMAGRSARVFGDILELPRRRVAVIVVEFGPRREEGQIAREVKRRKA